MFDDANDELLTFWPIDMIEGEESAELETKLMLPQAGWMQVTHHSKAWVWVRWDSNPFFNLTINGPIDLRSMPAGEKTFYFKVQALSPITGLELANMKVSVIKVEAAGWTI